MFYRVPAHGEMIVNLNVEMFSDFRGKIEEESEKIVIAQGIFAFKEHEHQWKDDHGGELNVIVEAKIIRPYPHPYTYDANG